MEDLSHYINFFRSFPSYICSSSNLALKYVSYQASSLPSLWTVVVETALFKSLLHINVARKVTAIHLMRWYSSFSLKYFCILILSVCVWSLSSSLESLGRLPKPPECLLDWYSSGPRRVTSSDFNPPPFPYAIIYSRASSVIYFSSDISILANRA